MGDWLIGHGLASAADLEGMRREEEQTIEDTFNRIGREELGIKQ
jgi:hypothetical protein